MPQRNAELDSLHADLVAARTAVRERQHVELCIADAQVRLGAARQRAAALTEAHLREKADVDRLDRGPWKLFYAVVGKLDARRAREEAEVVAAALQLDGAAAERDGLQEELAALHQRLATLLRADDTLRAALARKEAWLRAHDDEASRALAALDERDAALRAEAREVGEALVVADLASKALSALLRSLEGAGTWGTLDLIGGGLLTSTVKYAQMDEAAALIPDTQRLLDRLRAECQDIGLELPPEHLHLDRSGRFMDTFFDNVVSDWRTTGRIDHARVIASTAASTVAAVAPRIRRRRAELTREIAAVAEERQRLVEA